jgi:hypothetical protein
MVEEKRAHLAQLKQEFNSLKGGIKDCNQLWQRMQLAEERKHLLDNIEACELALEKDRVANAVAAFEEVNPPVTEECPLCHDSIKISEWSDPTLRSKGAP